MDKSVLGAVLAGGESRRMGCNKATLPFHGKPLIKSVIDPLKSIFSEVIIISNKQQTYDFLKLPVLTDIIPKCGPLGGIYTALVYGNSRPLFVIACDLPLISKEFIQYILDYDVSQKSTSFFSKNKPIAKIPIQQDRLHPLCGWYSSGCLDLIKKNLEQRQLKVLNFLKQIHTIPVPLASEKTLYGQDLLSNINTEEKYQHLLDHH